MTESDILFDTWAWWEYLHDTKVGESLADRFTRKPEFRIHTSAISLAELAAKLESIGAMDRIAISCGAVRRMSHVWDVTADIAQQAGAVRAKLRDSSRSSGLADAIILVTSIRAGARIVSADPAFKNIPGIIRD